MSDLTSTSLFGKKVCSSFCVLIDGENDLLTVIHNGLLTVNENGLLLVNKNRLLTVTENCLSP